MRRNTMKRSCKEIIQTIKANFSWKKAAAIVLGAVLLVSFFTLGMAYENMRASGRFHVADSSTQYTIETLKPFNGQDGAKAYVAYNDIVYDVSGSDSFVNGVNVYNPKIAAGTDISGQMNITAPGDLTREYMESLPQVGLLVCACVYR